MERENMRAADEEQLAETSENDARIQGEIDQRAAMLLEQAEAILEAGGPDMVEVFRQDQAVRENVLSGAWDFQVAYGYLLGRESVQRNARRPVPSAVRAPNHANTRKGIASMSDREFNELDERLARGEIIDPGR